MRPAATLTAFAAGLTAVFAVALGLGSAVGPVVADKPAPQHAADDAHDDDAEATHDEDAAHDAAGASTLPGLSVSDAGWRLHLASDTASPGDAVPFRFTVTAPDGNPETDYVRTHTKELHLIVVRRDLSSFQHVHPVRAADGSWSVPLDLPAGGSYRVFADFRPAGLDRTLTLGADLSVPGEFAPQALPGREPHHDHRRVRRHAGRYAGRRPRERLRHVGQPRRRTGHRPAALPRRIRPPGRAARR